MRRQDSSAFFDRTARDWQDQYLDQGLRGRQVRKRMLLTLEYLREERFSPGARILDLGCGPGMIAEELVSRGFLVSCVDFSYELLSRAYDRLKGRDGTRPQFVQADAYTLPFKRAAFDAIVCIGVISWVVDPVKVLHEIARVLKPGGTLVITARNKLSVENLFEPLFWWRQLVPMALRRSLRTVWPQSAVKEEDTDPSPQEFRLRQFDVMILSEGLAKTRWRTIKYGHFRCFGRRIFPIRVEVAIDSALDRLWWVPIIRTLGWLYCVKATRATDGKGEPVPIMAASQQDPVVGSRPDSAISRGSD